MSEFRFTREVLAIIRARIACGDEDWEIAGRLGCELSTLHDLCGRHGYDNLKDSRHRVPITTTAINERTRAAFARAAADRNTTPARLMADCLEIIAKDRLFIAVLGD